MSVRVIGSVVEDWEGPRLRYSPGGHLKFPHLWPGQIPPVDSDGTVCVYAL